MLPAFLTTIFFSISVVCGHRSARLLGGTEANFWRLVCAACFLGIWAAGFGQGLASEGLPVFLLSGIIGIGVGDVALFQALPRLGPRLTLLLVQCLTAPMGATIEWLWLGTGLRPRQMLCGAVILVGVVISLAPGKHMSVPRNRWIPGMLYSLLAAFGGAWGAVLSRKAYGMLQRDGQLVDGGTAAFQRVVGGLLVAGVCLLVVKRRAVRLHLMRSDEVQTLPSREKWRRAWPWILANGLAGQTLGVSCYQWAFQTTPTGVVLPIAAMTPLVAMPIIRIMDGERMSWQAGVGGAVAVAGAVGLTLVK